MESRSECGTHETLSWLLDPADPGVRYLALRDLVGLAADDPELLAAQAAAHQTGPIAAVLEAMNPAGFWVRPGHGYNPKYRSAVWALILLAQLGADARYDERVAQACAYILDHGLTPLGQFSTTGAPSGTVDCLQGNLCDALLALGYSDPRLDLAFDWLARSLTGEGVAPASESRVVPRYYAYKCGPGFACGVNGGLPCAWGAVKVMLAFGRLPAARRTPLVNRALAQGVEFLFSCDPAAAAYPTRGNSKPNRGWWKFGFPVFYVTDVLQTVEALVRLGYGADPRLQPALALVRRKADAQGRWPLEYDYADKTWIDVGPKRQPNKWVTLRALRALDGAAR